MALRRIAHRRRPLLAAPRAFFSSNPPFPPPPPPPSTDSDAAHPPSSPPPDPGAQQNRTSVLFADIRNRLRSSSASAPPRRIPMNPGRPNPEGGPTPTKPPLDEVRQMLNSFRANGGGTSPPGTLPRFSELITNSSARAANAGKSPHNFDKIRDSLKGFPQQKLPRSPPQFLSPVSPIFDKERDKNAKAGGQGKEEDNNAAFTLTGDYSYEDLGKRLEELRPTGVAKDGKDWFSVEELLGRIAKLVELEKQRGELAASMSEVRKSIVSLKERKKQPLFGSLQTLSLGQNKEYLRLPPQEELVERYFHPDHMSSEEKMKLELQRVRDEFKMSENDCGSARVQIAQLTLKIKHLSAVLHKKDKHSRKGLQEMVQRRKKYLKYLRRTDWDSYCLVLSKLGLRDVPEYKAPDYKSKPTTKAKSKKSKSRGKKKRKMKA